MVAALLVVSIVLVVSVVVILLVVTVTVDVPIIAMGVAGIYSFWIARVITAIWHLNVCGADGRNKRTLHCGDYFHSIGSGFLGGIDSGFWLAATCYCPEGGVSASSLLLAVQAQFSIVFKKVIDVFGHGV
jgi:hypothetical protein